MLLVILLFRNRARGLSSSCGSPVFLPCSSCVLSAILLCSSCVRLVPYSNVVEYQGRRPNQFRNDVIPTYFLGRDEPLLRISPPPPPPPLPPNAVADHIMIFIQSTEKINIWLFSCRCCYTCYCRFCYARYAPEAMEAAGTAASSRVPPAFLPSSSYVPPVSIPWPSRVPPALLLCSSCVPLPFLICPSCVPLPPPPSPPPPHPPLSPPHPCSPFIQVLGY